MSSVRSASDTEEWVGGVLVDDLPSLLSILEPSFSVSGSDFRTLETRAKRFRSQNWSPEEKLAYLETKVEARQVVQGKDWEFISDRLWENHGFDRSSKSCEDFWYTILKAYRAICEYEASKSARTSEWISYWSMDEDWRSTKKLPRVFEFHWYEMIEEILAPQERRSPSTDPTGPSTAKCSGRKGSCAIVEKEPQLFIEALAPFFKQHIEDEVNSALESLPCRKTFGATTEQEERLTKIAPLVKQQVEAAVVFQLKILAVSGFIFDEDDPITRLVPFVRKYIKDALSSALQSVSSALRALAQKEEEDQKKLQAIEEQRRALDMEEMKIKRQRVGRNQRSQRTCYKRQGPRGKNSSAEGVIPALKGMSIARDQDQVVLPKNG